MGRMKQAQIIGAGLAGAVAARILAERGWQVRVYELRDQIGGNCHDAPDPETGILVHTYGPHIFHTNNRQVWDFCQRFTRFRLFQHRVLSYVDGQLLPFPINRDTLCQLFGIQLSTREVPEFLAAEVASAGQHHQPTNFREAIISQVGEELYEKFFRNYTAKQWDRDPAELSSELAGRIPVRSNRDDRYFSDRYQGIPEDGYTEMIRRMLDDPNITLHLGCDGLSAGESVDLTVVTSRLDVYFGQADGELAYRSVRFEFRNEAVEWYQPAAVVNYPNDYDFTRITEFKHMTGQKSAATSICLEYPSREGVPCYVVPDAANQARRERYLLRAQALEEAGTHVFVGRLAEYRYYNMDQVIASVMAKLDAVAD